MALLAAATPVRATERVPAVLHVHSTLSTGSRSLDDLATQAEREGLGAIFLAENYLLRIEYGLFPFRALTRVVYEETSVFDRLEAYLAHVAEVRARHPRVIIVPGVEVIPHYYWSGTPLTLALTLHDTQKNLLVFGLGDAESLKALPATGNPHTRSFAALSLLDAAPALLVVPGLILLARPRVRRVRLGTAVIVVRRRRWLLAGTLVAVGVLALVRGWPFTVDPHPPWSAFGLDPHQALIDEAERRGGAAVWSFPEAFDVGERQMGPVHVAWRTDPYPDDLLRVGGYTAFGAVYEQATRFTRPGEGWDRLLAAYIAGERARPAWGVAESGFHSARANKRLNAVQTVLLVDQRTPAAALDALKRGRMYAVRRSGDAGLVLSEFTVNASVGAAEMGATLSAPAGTPLELRTAVEAERGAAHPVRVTLVKNGQVAAVWTGTTPLRVVHQDIADTRPAFYRVEARVSTAEYLLGNPIFIRP